MQVLAANTVLYGPRASQTLKVATLMDEIEMEMDPEGGDEDIE
jgi:hypothetical protein